MCAAPWFPVLSSTPQYWILWLKIETVMSDPALSVSWRSQTKRKGRERPTLLHLKRVASLSCREKFCFFGGNTQWSWHVVMHRNTNKMLVLAVVSHSLAVLVNSVAARIWNGEPEPLILDCCLHSSRMLLDAEENWDSGGEPYPTLQKPFLQERLQQRSRGAQDQGTGSLILPTRAIYRSNKYPGIVGNRICPPESKDSERRFWACTPRGAAKVLIIVLHRST